MGWFLIHGVLFTVLALLVFPVLWLRPKTRPGAMARLGFPDLNPAQWPPGPRLWVHAASAGDVKNVWPVVERLVAGQPDLVVILTVVTNTGAQMAAQVRPAPHAVSFLPLDAAPMVSRTLRVIAPDLLMLECTELWPTLLRAAQRAGVPMVLCNGRMSARSLRRYRVAFRALWNPVPHLRALCLQTPEDRARYLELGARADRCTVTGNCKFDAAARVAPEAKVAGLTAALGPGPWWVAGSTHAGEEAVITAAAVAARAAGLPHRLLWAPRYVEHVARLQQACADAGLSTSLRSQCGQGAASQVVILDTMGELAAAYRLAVVAVVGGSFVPRGGQNLLEPAACGVPVLHGPHMFLAPDQTAALDGHGAELVEAAALPGRLVAWLSQPQEASALGQRGQAVVRELAGAAERHATALAPHLPVTHRWPPPSPA